MKNCVDIVRPFVRELAGQNIQLFGGVGSAALANADTVIVTDEKRIVAPDYLNLPQRRDDGNLRDLDALVLTSDRVKVEQVEEQAKAILGDELEVSIFGLLPAAKLEWQKRHPFHPKTLRTALADRYVNETDGQITDAQKALFPFAVPMDLETLETWHLFIGDKDKSPIPVPHPGATILNYLTRSAGGLRPKDTVKVYAMATHIAEKSPETRDWIMDGPGRSQIELARIMNKLGNKGKTINTPAATLVDYEGELSEHPAFMMHDSSTAMQSAVLWTSRKKARLVRFGESQEQLVTFWQRHIEPRIKGTVHNQ